MFEDNEEMLKRNVVRVKLPTKLQTALNHLHNIWSYSDIASLAGQNWPPHGRQTTHLLHHQLADVDKIASLNQHWVSFSWTNWGATMIIVTIVWIIDDLLTIMIIIRMVMIDHYHHHHHHCHHRHRRHQDSLDNRWSARAQELAGKLRRGHLAMFIWWRWWWWSHDDDCDHMIKMVMIIWWWWWLYFLAQFSAETDEYIQFALCL